MLSLLTIGSLISYLPGLDISKRLPVIYRPPGRLPFRHEQHHPLVKKGVGGRRLEGGLDRAPGKLVSQAASACPAPAGGRARRPGRRPRSAARPAHVMPTLSTSEADAEVEA